jgi:hypothetical protein
MNHQDLQNIIDSLEAMPEFLRRLTKGLSSAELTRKSSEKEFSVLEHVWHLRDIETEGYSVRIKRLLSENRPVLQDIDGGKLAAERGYNQLDFAEGLEVFTRARRDNIRSIKGLTLEQLNCSGIFEDAAPVTLERVLQMMREHDEAHRKELQDLVNLSMGKISSAS